jgi:hypothetical protein
MTTAQVDAEVAKLQAGLDAEVAGLKKSMQARATRTNEVKQELAPNKQRLDELINRLNGVPDEATLKGSKTQLENDIKDSKLEHLLSIGESKGYRTYKIEEIYEPETIEITDDTPF